MKYKNACLLSYFLLPFFFHPYDGCIWIVCIWKSLNHDKFNSVYHRLNRLYTSPSLHSLQLSADVTQVASFVTCYSSHSYGQYTTTFVTACYSPITKLLLTGTLQWCLLLTRHMVIVDWYLTTRKLLPFTAHIECPYIETSRCLQMQC